MKNKNSNGIIQSIQSIDRDYFHFRKDLIIKLKQPSPQIKEIYDIDYLNILYQKTVYSNVSNNSSGIHSLSSSLSTSVLNLSRNSFNSGEQINFSNANSPRSSIAKSIKSDVYSAKYGDDDDDDEEPLSFQDFVSSIINCEDKERHVLIIQDIAKLLEIKFREFKKSTSTLSNKSLTQNSGIYLNSDSDLFTKIATSVCKLATEEPNGILGAILKLRLVLDNGNVFDVCERFAYDPSTVATSEIIATVREEKTGIKKFFEKFPRTFSSFGRYFSLNIDANNFDILKNRLY